MEYQVSHRRTLKSIFHQWKRWGLIYVITFILSTIVSPVAETQYLTIRIFGYSYVSSIPVSYILNLSYLAMAVLFTLILYILITLRINTTLRSDATKLKQEILGKSGQIGPLLGDVRKADIDALLDDMSLLKREHITFWELVFLRNYLRFIEIVIRQSTRAPEDLLESFTINDISLLFDTRSLEPPFTTDEYEIFLQIMTKMTTVRIWHRIWYRFRRKKMSLVHLLTVGINRSDYENGNLNRLANLLDELVSSTKTPPNLFTPEEIKNLIRLAHKRYDFSQIQTLPTLDVRFQIIINNASSFIEFDTAGHIRVYELDGSEPFRITFGTDVIDAVDKLLIEGYNGFHRVQCPVYKPQILESKEFLIATEKLTRRHRYDLGPIFCSTPTFENDSISSAIRDYECVLDSEIQMKDASNLMMAVLSFVRRQSTIHKIVSYVKDSDEPIPIPLLLRVNLYPMTTHNDSFPFEFNPNRTLTTAGLMRLLSRIPAATTKICELFSPMFLSQLPSVVGSGTYLSFSHCSTRLDLPTLHENQPLKAVYPTYYAAKTGSLGWIATGGGAWIITQGIVDSFGSVSNNLPTKKWMIFFDSPLQEKVFLETLTHQNYHYTWEILRNCIDFQKQYRSKIRNTRDLSLLWSREPFQPVGPMCFVNPEFIEALKQELSHGKSSQMRHSISVNMQILERLLCLIDDYMLNSGNSNKYPIIMMSNRLNQLIRGPVNSVPMVFVECPEKLSIIPSLTYDYFVRQWMFDKISHAFVNGDILTSSTLRYRIHWLSPIGPETASTSVDFNHSFSQPETWVQPGFLDLLVKEAKCAYSMIRIFSLYIDYIERGLPLPFRVTKHIRDTNTTADLKSLQSSYDFLCDFLTGQGEFASRIAIAGEHGYLPWLQKVIEKLEDVGTALGARDIFRLRRRQCLYWYKKLYDLSIQLDDPLSQELGDMVKNL